MMEKGILFLARLKSSDYKKEQAALSAPDTWVDIHLDKSRIRHYKGTDIGRRMEGIGHITLRMVKVPLPENREEVLITNLPSEPFGRQQIAELYHMRWGHRNFILYTEAHNSCRELPRKKQADDYT